jgi:hypothetical protein
MSTTLAKIRFLTIDYDSFHQPGSRTSINIQAHGPFEPTGNKNTKVRIERDATNPFKFALHYQADQVPSRDDIFEWSASTLFLGQTADADGKVTVTIVFFGNAELGEKELKFEMVPGDIVGRHAPGGGEGALLL